MASKIKWLLYLQWHMMAFLYDRQNHEIVRIYSLNMTWYLIQWKSTETVVCTYQSNNPNMDHQSHLGTQTMCDYGPNCHCFSHVAPTEHGEHDWMFYRAYKILCQIFSDYCSDFRYSSNASPIVRGVFGKYVDKFDRMRIKYILDKWNFA